MLRCHIQVISTIDTIQDTVAIFVAVDSRYLEVLQYTENVEMFHLTCTRTSGISIGRATSVGISEFLYLSIAMSH